MQNGLKNKAGKPVKLPWSQPMEEGLELPFILVNLNPREATLVSPFMEKKKIFKKVTKKFELEIACIFQST